MGLVNLCEAPVAGRGDGNLLPIIFRGMAQYNWDYAFIVMDSKNFAGKRLAVTPKLLTAPGVFGVSLCDGLASDDNPINLTLLLDTTVSAGEVYYVDVPQEPQQPYIRFYIYCSSGTSRFSVVISEV